MRLRVNAFIVIASEAKQSVVNGRIASRIASGFALATTSICHSSEGWNPAKGQYSDRLLNWILTFVRMTFNLIGLSRCVHRNDR